MYHSHVPYNMIPQAHRLVFERLSVLYNILRKLLILKFLIFFYLIFDWLKKKKLLSNRSIFSYHIAEIGTFIFIQKNLFFDIIYFTASLITLESLLHFEHGFFYKDTFKCHIFKFIQIELNLCTYMCIDLHYTIHIYIYVNL